MRRLLWMTGLALCQAVLSGALAQAEEGPPADLDRRLRDIRGPVRYIGPTPWAKVLSVAGGFAAASAALSLLALRSIRQREAALVAAGEKPKPDVRAGAEALQALDKLGASGLWEARRFPAFSDELSRILRAYVRRTLCQTAEVRTTDELISEVRELGRVLHASRLQELLVRADLAKFAKYEAFVETPVPEAKVWVEEVDRSIRPPVEDEGAEEGAGKHEVGEGKSG